jgi:hypothetical protein
LTVRLGSGLPGLKINPTSIGSEEV